MNMTAHQARIIMNALGIANAMRFDQLENDGTSSIDTDTKLMLRDIINYLDTIVPAGQTLDGGNQAYPNQKFSGMFGQTRRHNLV